MQKPNIELGRYVLKQKASCSDSEVLCVCMFMCVCVCMCVVCERGESLLSLDLQCIIKLFSALKPVSAEKVTDTCYILGQLITSSPGVIEYL